MKWNQFIFIFGIILLSACTKDTISTGVSLDQSILNNTQPIPSQYKALMEGVFTLSSGNAKLGNSFVGVWKRNNFCFFSNKNGTYIYFEAGFNPTDSSIILSGVWRSALLEDEPEKVKAIISKEELSKIVTVYTAMASSFFK